MTDHQDPDPVPAPKAENPQATPGPPVLPAPEPPPTPTTLPPPTLQAPAPLPPSGSVPASWGTDGSAAPGTPLPPGNSWATPEPPEPPEPSSARRLQITSEDLQTPEVESRVAALNQAAVAPLVRSVGAPVEPTSRKWYRSSVAAAAIAGTIGGALGWMMSEVSMRPDDFDAPFSDDPAIGVAIWLAIFAVGLSALLSGWEGIESKNRAKVFEAWKRSIPITAAGGLVGGFVAQKLYEPLFERAVDRADARATSETEFYELIDAALRIPRSFGFLIAGAVVGIALGFASGTTRRAVNGAIGGAIGGFVGGLLFSYVSQNGELARAIAMTVTGIAVGAAIGLVEEARKEIWLEIVNGGMGGKQFILYHEQTTIGSAPACHVTLIKDAHIAAHHASVIRGPGGPELRAAPGAPLLVNGVHLERSPINNGDEVQIGTTLLRFGLREQAMPTVAGSPPR